MVPKIGKWSRPQCVHSYRNSTSFPSGADSSTTIASGGAAHASACAHVRACVHTRTHSHTRAAAAAGVTAQGTASGREDNAEWSAAESSFSSQHI